MTGLKRTPFFEIELPRTTKLRPTSKSISISVVPGPMTTGSSSLILIPFFPADGHFTSGVVLSSSVIPDSSVSMIIRNPRYVPSGRLTDPRFAVLPPVRSRRLSEVFGDTRVIHSPSSESSAASAESTSATRPSIRTTKMSTLWTSSNGKGASVRRMLSCPDSLPVLLDSVQARVARPATANAASCVSRFVIIGYLSEIRRIATARYTSVTGRIHASHHAGGKEKAALFRAAFSRTPLSARCSCGGSLVRCRWRA